jgi:hypothetical protein
MFTHRDGSVHSSVEMLVLDDFKLLQYLAEIEEEKKIKETRGE